MNNFSIRRRGEYALIFTDRPDPKMPNEKADVIEVTVAYDKGGMNYFSGCENRRGIYVHVTPIELTCEDAEEGRTVVIRWQMIASDIKTSGAKLFVMPLARKSDKKLVEVAERLDILAPEICRVFRENPAGAFELIKNAFATDTVTA